MDSRVYSTAIAILIATTPAIAQTTTNSGTSTSPTDTTASPDASSPSGATTSPPSTSATDQGASGSSETPVNVSPSPIEQNRLDPSAPSPERLLIDPGAAAGSTVTNPAENSSNPSAPGESYNAILGGSSSNNGTSTGTSGLGVTPAPSALSPSMYPRPLTTPPAQNPASNYPAPLTTPHFTQPTMTPGAGIGMAGHGSGIEAHSSLQGHAFSHGPMAGGHAAGGHR